jgi:hypothetical protein
VCLVVAGLAPDAFAQVIEGQPRPTGTRFGPRAPVDPNRVTQQLTLNFNFTGGYDENREVRTPGLPVDRVLFQQDGYAQAGAANLTYRRGTQEKYISGNGRAYVNRGIAVVGPPAGGDASLSGTTSLGDRMGASLGVGTAYEPTSLSNAFGALSDQIEGVTVPDVTPTQAMTSERWLSAQANGSVYREWTTRQRTELYYVNAYRESFNGPSLNSLMKLGTVRHSWDPKRSAGFRFNYSFSDHRQSDVEEGRPLRVQTADVTLRLDRRLSPRRRLGFTIGAGASHTKRLLIETGEERGRFLPTMFGSAHLDLLRSWVLSADARRDITVLDGISLQPFVTDAAAVRLEGYAAARILLTFSGAISIGDSALSDTGDFQTITGTAQAQYVFGRTLGLFGAYTYYEHRLQGITHLQVGLPGNYNRNSVRVGMTVWLPVIGE